ncbi:MAG: thioredoxin-disulfide reductase [Acidobacteriota bacterium]
MQDPTTHTERRQLVIIGSGPAGFTAALYAARAELDVLLLKGAEPGGQLISTPEIENYPGFPEALTGIELMSKMEAQAERFGAELRYGQVTELDLSSRPYRLQIDDDAWIETDAVILSTGASAKYLGLDNERRLLGRGVSACATCDGAFFRDVEVAVVGGGDTAMEEALFLTRFATRVTVIHRRDELRASRILQERAFAHPKIEFLWNRQVEDILGEDRVEGLRLVDTVTGETSTLPTGGVFIAIGHRPNTDLVRDALPLDPHGYLTTEPGSTHTALPGVFACGDVQDSIYRQAITAAGTGAMAALDAERWLAEQESADSRNGASTGADSQRIAVAA